MKTITLEEVLRVTKSVLTGKVMPPLRRVALADHYKRGIKTGETSEYVTIALNNVWGARTKSGGSISSYEKIGYHTGSVDFILGVLSTDCPVYVYRYGDGGKLEKYRLVQF